MFLSRQLFDSCFHINSEFEMQSKPANSFFQISINTEKFSQFTTTLNQVLQTHERQLQQQARELSQLRIVSDERLARVRSECQYECQQLDRKCKEEAQHTATFHRDLTIKQQTTASEHHGRLTGIQQELVQIKAQLQGQEASITGSVIGKVQQQIQSLLITSKTHIDRQMENVSRKIKEMELSTANHDILVRNIINAYQSRRPGTSDSSQVKPSDELRSSGPEKSLFEQQIAKEGRERRKKKVQEKCEQENLQYASISAKLDLLENRLSAKENQALDKVVYAKKAVESPSEDGFAISMAAIEAERRSLEDQISQKLQGIDSIVRQKFQKLEAQVGRQSHAQALIRDELDATVRRLQKEKGRLTEIITQIKRLDQRRVDQKMVQNMVAMFKRQHRALEDELEKKLSAENFNRERQRLSERIQVLSESLSEKADKEEIKRAFQFVEDKIKQIVLIIADDIQHQKEGAARRTPIKCLSCDKDIEASLPITLRNNNTDKKILRSPTAQIRKKLRTPHNEERT